MDQYHKIQTVYKRDDKGHILVGEWTRPEFEYLKDLQWAGTEKVDGTNIRVGWRRGEPLDIRGRTDKAQIPAPLLNQLHRLLSTELFDELIDSALTDSMTLYGEGYGNKIQKVGHLYHSDEVDFVLFDVRVGDVWLERETVSSTASLLGIKAVPCRFRGTLEQAIYTVRVGFDSAWGSFPAEGLVLRPVVELQDRLGKRIIVKIKTRDFTSAE